MLFDGAFHVPSWLRQLSIGPMDVIAHCRREEGGEFGLPTQGAVALAEWLLADTVRAEREAKRPGSPLFMGGVITRLLAGSHVPSPELIESIGGMTGGAITFDMFERVAADLPAENALAAQDVPGPDPEPQPQARPAVLGEIASGPLWKARRSGDIIEVDSGFGLRFNLTLAAGDGLKRDLELALPPPSEPAPAHTGVY